MSKITDWVSPSSKTGEFKRQESTFRNQISDEPGGFPAESGRYHLYISWACPWAHRTVIALRLKNLQKHISVTSVEWFLGENGWKFATEETYDEKALVTYPPKDHLKGAKKLEYIRQLYLQSDPNYTARFSVPVLFDSKTGQIVNNESAEILRIFGEQFNKLLSPEDAAVDLAPKSLLSEINKENEIIYHGINNAVYRAGFATTEEAYLKAVKELFSCLDTVEARFEKLEKEHGDSTEPGPFYFGSVLTETDIRLFTTIVRFDPVYVQHFKCNVRDIRSGYPALHRWLQRLYWNGNKINVSTSSGGTAVITQSESPFKETTNFEHIKKHYTKSHSQVNPLGITPLGPLPPIMPLL